MVPFSGAVVKKFPANIVSRLLSWKRVTYSDLEVLPHAKRLIEGGFVSRNDMLFCAMLERGSGKSLPVLLRFLRMNNKSSGPYSFNYQAPDICNQLPCFCQFF